MTLDNHAANGQSQSGPVGFCREKCIEYAVEICRIDPRSRVLDLNNNGIVAMPLGFQPQSPAACPDGVHRFNGILQQIDQHLLQLALMARDARQIGCQFDARHDTMSLQLFVQKAQDALSNFIHIDRLVLAIGF
jgi:hypothetical protein